MLAQAAADMGAVAMASAGGGLDCSAVCHDADNLPYYGLPLSVVLYYETALSGTPVTGASKSAVDDWVACYDLCRNTDPCYSW
jgi:hypothetical protein